MDYIENINLNEGKSSEKGLDVSILNADKVVTTPEEARNFLNKTVRIVEKYDGTKLTIIRTTNPYKKNSPETNWLVSYKGTVLNAEEFYGVKTISSSIGIRQYARVWEALRKNDAAAKVIPKSTEIFCEFIQHKDTLSRTYTKFGNIYVVGFAKTTYKDNGGKLESHPKEMNTDEEKCNHIAKLLGLSRPRLYFSGKLNDYKSAKYILPEIKTKLNKAGFSSLTNPLDKYFTIKNIFLSIESELGGKSEGVVIFVDHTELLKWVQDDTYSKEHRWGIKTKYRYEDKEKTNAYWKEVNDFITKLFKNKQINFDKPVKQVIAAVSDIIYSLEPKDVPIKHDLRDFEIIQDDIFETARNRIIKTHPDNSGVLIPGRFQPLSTMHAEIIQKALNEYKYVVVGIVSPKNRKPTLENPFSFETTEKLIKTVFGNKVYIVRLAGAYLPKVLDEIRYPVNTIMCGTDRLEGYKKQFENDPYVQVIEIPRVKPVSGTQIRNALLEDNKKEFEKLTMPQIHKYYNELRDEILMVARANNFKK